MSKTLGHALEGFIKGLTIFISEQKSSTEKKYSVERSLPVTLTMDTDIVVYEEKNGVKLPYTLCAVFHSLRRMNSDMKWKRSSQEYLESETLHVRHPAVPLHPNYHTILCAFGRGWKNEIISDMKDSLKPTLYFPDYLTKEEEEELFVQVEELYRSFDSSRTERVARHVSSEPYGLDGSTTIAALLEQTIWGYEQETPTPLVQEEIKRLEVCKPAIREPKPFRTRYNHGLTLLALFPPDEQRALFELSEVQEDADINALPNIQQEALLRGLFLGIIRLRRIGRGSKVRPIFYARQSAADIDIAYVLGRMNLADAQGILEDLRHYAAEFLSSYRGAVSALRMGNWRQLAPVALDVLRCLKEHIEDGGRASLLAQLCRTDVVVPELEVWDGQRTAMLAAWSFTVALLETLSGDRSYAQTFDLNRTDIPTELEAQALISKFDDVDRTTLQEKVTSAEDWFNALEARDWFRLASLPLPDAINIKVPSSWVNWQYNVLATHHTFNVATYAAYKYVARYEASEDQIRGFPKKNSEMIRRVIPSHRGRAKCAMIADLGRKVVAYEGKAITENHYGDKSKELFNRVGEFKRACVHAGLEGESVVVLDGDFSEANLSELGSAEGYDRIYSLDEFVPPKIS